MHPLLRYVVVGFVGFIAAGGIAVIALVSANPQLQVVTMIGAGLLATVVAAYLFVAACRWSVRAYRYGRTGRSALIALAGGLMALVAAGSLAGATIMALLFLVG